MGQTMRKDDPSEFARKLARHRWEGTPKSKRSLVVGRNGGRPKIYEPCPNGGGRHRFKSGVCLCGQVKKLGPKHRP